MEKVSPGVRTETQRAKVVLELKKDLQDNEATCPHCHGHGTGFGIAESVESHEYVVIKEAALEPEQDYFGFVRRNRCVE